MSKTDDKVNLVPLYVVLGSVINGWSIISGSNDQFTGCQGINNRGWNPLGVWFYQHYNLTLGEKKVLLACDSINVGRNFNQPNLLLLRVNRWNMDPFNWSKIHLYNFLLSVLIIIFLMWNKRWSGKLSLFRIFVGNVEYSPHSNMIFTTPFPSSRRSSSKCTTPIWSPLPPFQIVVVVKSRRSSFSSSKCSTPIWSPVPRSNPYSSCFMYTLRPDG